MGYSEIAEWVGENFDIENYGTAEDLIHDVQKRFNDDFIYFPPEATENINNIWMARVGIPMQREGMQEDPIIIRDSMKTPSVEPFSLSPIQEARPEYPEEAAIRQINQDQPAPPPPKFGWRNVFGSLGNRLRKTFGLGPQDQPFDKVK